MPYKKYQNNFGWCRYPFDNNPFGYCWGFATDIDNKKSKEEIRKSCSKKVTKKQENNPKYAAISMRLKAGDYWCEYYDPKQN